MSNLNPLNIQKPQDIHLSDEERHTQFKNAGLEENYSSMTGLIYNGNNVRTEVAGKVNIKELYNEIDGQIHQLEGYNQDGVNDVLDEYDEEYQDTISNISDKGAYDPTVAYHFGNVVDYSTLNSKITPKYTNKQTTTTGKNKYDNSIQAVAGNLQATTENYLSTGKRIIYKGGTTGTGTIFRAYALFDLTNYVGSHIYFKAKFTPSASNNGRYYIGLCNSDGSNRTSKSMISQSGEIVDFTVPTLSDGQTYLCLALYVNTENGTANTNDYVDYTDMILTIDDSDMTYEPYSNGVPSPSPEYRQPITAIKAVNLFDKDNANIYGMFINQSTGLLESKSTAKSIYIPIIGGNTYTVSRTSNITNRFSVATSDTLPTENLPKMPLEYIVDTDSLSITLATSSTAQYLIVYLSTSQSDATLIEQLQDLQIEEGDTPHTYAPYGKIPIRCYTNNLAVNSEYILDTEQTSSISWGKCSSDYINVKYGDTYTLSFYYNDVLNYSSTYGYAYVYAYNSNKEKIGTDYMSTQNLSIITKTILDPNITYLKVQMGVRGHKGDNFKLQLEEGSTRTEYKPYYNKYFYLDLQGNELSKIEEEDDDITIDGNNIILNKRISKIVLNGSSSENWTNEYAIHLFTLNNTLSFKQGATSLSDFYRYNTVQSGINLAMVNGEYALQKSSSRLFIKNTDFSTVSDFKTWLSTHNTTVYYVLATPQTISLGTLPADFLPHIGNVNIEVCTNLEATNKYNISTDSYLTLQDTTAGTLPTNTTYFKNIGLTGDIGDSSMGTVTCGVWDSTTTYNEKDLVAYGTDLYVAKQANTNQTPSSASQYWELIIQYDKPLVALSNYAPDNIIKGSLWFDII